MAKLGKSTFLEICDEIADGKTLSEICRSRKIHKLDVWRAMKEDEELERSYAHAREMQAECWADRLVEAASKPNVGEKIKTMPDGSEEVTTGDNVERSRLEVDAIKWLIGKNHVRRFGDKIQQEVTGANGGPLIIKWGEDSSAGTK